MEGQLRLALRAVEEVVVTVVVLELTVVLDRGVVEEDEVVAGAACAWTSLVDESTFRWIFSTWTAGVRLEDKVTEVKKEDGDDINKT